MEAGGVSLSLNEVETLAAKAVRGAGAGWGVATDVARAVRWLAERGLPWSEPLLGLLAGGAVASELRPVFHAADRIAGAREGDGWTMESAEMTWALPILAASLWGRALALALTGEAGAFRLGTDGAASADRPWTETDRLSRRSMIALKTEAAADALPHGLRPVTRRGIASPAILGDLDRYAARTYVPASAHSRATGAGGGRIDDE